MVAEDKNRMQYQVDEKSGEQPRTELIMVVNLPEQTKNDAERVIIISGLSDSTNISIPIHSFLAQVNDLLNHWFIPRSISPMSPLKCTQEPTNSMFIFVFSELSSNNQC